MHLDLLGDWKRTHYAGDLRAADADKEVLLMGWVHRRRDLGDLIFIDVRDRGGIAQIVFNKELGAAVHARAEELRSEFVVAICGTVARRSKPNPDLPSGEVEVFASELRLLNTSKTPPFVIEDEVSAGEETRLRYRYLDMRRPQLQRNLALRHRIVLEMRKTLDALGFLEVETPMLTRSTPEGARDYLVPSRVHPGHFYALPQSPQMFKQLLMIGGYDKYFQIARCFRDEDLRADRQPDFTQLDLEMSFPRQDDIFGVIQQVMLKVCAVAGVTVQAPFRRMEYREAIRRFGIDKPDLRFGMELCDVTPHFAAGREKFRIEGSVQALAATGAATFSRKQLDELAEHAKKLGARGLYTVKVAAEGITSSLDKTLGADAVAAIVAATGAKPGDLVVAVAAAEQIPGTDASALIAGQLRLSLAEKLSLIPKDRWEFLWLTGFPLFEWSTTDKGWAPAQHPFTGIVEEDIDKLESAPQDVRSKGYDLVLNGVELGSGSIRIHSQELQSRVFGLLGLDEEKRRQRFGFFLDALNYGTPPHGGIALGIDRICALMSGEKSLREVIAFPKTTAAQDLMAEAPSPVDRPQEDELEILVAYPGLDSQNSALAGLCDRLMSLVERKVTSKPPIDTHFQQAMSLLVAKSQDDARAVTKLGRAGYGLQAAGLSRSLVETAINSAYIGLDPERHSQSYLTSIGRSNKRLVSRLAPHASKEEIQRLTSEAQEVSQESGWPVTLKQRANAVQQDLYLYDVVYLMLSQILHGDIASVAGRLTESAPDKYELLVGPSNHWVQQALATCFVGLHEVARVSFLAFGLTETNLGSLYAEFQAFTVALKGSRSL